MSTSTDHTESGNSPPKLLKRVVNQGYSRVRLDALKQTAFETELLDATNHLGYVVQIRAGSLWVCLPSRPRVEREKPIIPTGRGIRGEDTA